MDGDPRQDHSGMTSVDHSGMTEETQSKVPINRNLRPAATMYFSDYNFFFSIHFDFISFELDFIFNNRWLRKKYIAEYLHRKAYP
jgi:hypothetical protein